MKFCAEVLIRFDTIQAVAASSLAIFSSERRGVVCESQLWNAAGSKMPKEKKSRSYSERRVEKGVYFLNYIGWENGPSYPHATPKISDHGIIFCPKGNALPDEITLDI